MSVKDTLIGAKGGGSTFRNRPDNLRSNDTFEALIGLCSGRIKGLAPGGLKNLMIDDVPIEDGSGNTTLKDFNAILFDGDPAYLRPVTLQLGGSSGSNPVGLPINNNNTGAGTGTPGDWRYATVTQPNVDYIDLRFIVSALFRQDKKGIYDETASLEIELQPSGSSTWTNPLASTSAPTYNPNGIKLSGLLGVALYALADNWSNSNTWYDPTPGFLSITGKTTQPYVKELRIAVPNTGSYANRTWQVRVRLRERASYTQDEKQEARTIQWESIAGVSMAPIGNREEWRGLSYLQINGKASDQLTGVPVVTGIYDLSMVRVPPASVWNAETRTYTNATWDGVTEEIQWTQCPAFQMKDLIEDGVSGISALTPGSTLNKWDALEASKWFAQRVPDGKGGTHPRYSMNYLLDSAMSINDLMQYVAGAVGSYAWDEGDGNWRLIVEKPENPTALFTKESIVGEFRYAHTDIDSRYNDIIGVFRNEARQFEEDRVRVFDQAHIDKYGRRATTIALVGCTNRQEALRRVKIRQLTSLYENRQVSFTTNRQGNLVQPFSVILVADGELSNNINNRTTGRIVSKSGNTITLRDTVRLETGVSYKVHITTPNANYIPDTNSQPSGDWRKPTVTITRNITNTVRGDVRSLSLDSSLPADVADNAHIALEAVGLPTIPKQYRVVDVEPEGEMVNITAVEIYTSKWAESDAVDEAAILAQTPKKEILPPTNGAFSVKTFPAEYQVKRVLTVTWDRPASIWIDGFKVEYNLNAGPWQTLTEKTQDSYVELQQPQNGVYAFRITTVDRRGGVSKPLEIAYELADTPEDYAPVHKFGPLSARPASGQREGEKYTTNNQSPNVTYVWYNGQWVEESNLVTKADQILYGPGENLKSFLDSTTSDSVLSRGSEKSDYIVQYNVLYDDLIKLNNRYTDLGNPSDLTAARTLANNEWTALVNYLNGLSPVWNNVTVDTPIDANTWRNKWIAAITAINAYKTQITGRAGQNAYTFRLSNEQHQLPADKNGNVLAYTGATFSTQVLYGTQDVTSQFIPIYPNGGNPQALFTTNNYPNYSVDGGFDANEDTATFLIRLTGTGPHAGATGDVTFSLSKSKEAVPGVSPPLITISASADYVKYNAAGAIASGPITFYAQRTNTTDTPVFQFEALDGTIYYAASAGGLANSFPNMFSSTGPDNITITQAWVNDITNTPGGFRVQVYVASGARDRMTLRKISDGAQGAKGEDGYNNMLDMSPWIPGGTGSAGRFGANGDQAENSIVLGVGPSGGSEPLWKGVSNDAATGGSSDGDGGWGYDLKASDGWDVRKTYRMMAWVKRSPGSTGSLYIGTGGNASGGLIAPSGQQAGGDPTNPYFWVGTVPDPDKWYLMVGILHGAGYTGPDSGISGVYDPETGQKLPGGFSADWVQRTGASQMTYRVYQYYAGVGSTVYFAKPAVEEMGRANYTVQQLLATVGMTAAQRLELTAAQARITSISSDAVLDRSEKRQTLIDWNTLSNDADALETRYQALGAPADLTTVRNTSNTRKSELGTYLGSLTPGWTNTAVDTPIVADTWREKWNLANAAVAAFRAAILGKTGAPFAMLARGAGYIDGNKIGKSANGIPNAYDSDVYSATGYRNGAYLSFRSQQLNQALLIGFSSNPTVDQSYSNMDASWHLSGNGRCYVYVGGSVLKDVDVYDTNSTFAITYDGQRIRWYRNGLEVHSIASAPDRTFYFDSSFYQPNIGVKDVAFGPMVAASAGAMTLVPINSNTSVQGSSVSCYTDGGWGAAAAVSQESYQGGCSATFLLPANGGKNVMAGLSQTGFNGDAGFGVITFALHHADNGNTGAYINGNFYGSGPNIATSSALGKVEYDGRYVRWYINGNVFSTFDWMGPTGDGASEVTKLFFRCALASSQPRLDNIVFLPRGAIGKNGVDGLPGDRGNDGTTWYPYIAYANSPDGSVDFTTGEPGNRAYVGTATGTSASEPQIPGLYAWSQYKGPPFGLAVRGSAVVAGDQVIKNGGASDWDSDAYSTVSYRSGAAASFQFAGGSQCMAGLNTDPTTNASYNSLDFAFYAVATGDLRIYESNNDIGSVGSYNDATKLQVQYDGRYIRYFKDGALVRGPIDYGANALFYFDSSLHIPGSRITNIGFVANGTLGANGQDGAPGRSFDVSTNAVIVNASSTGVPKDSQLPRAVSLKALIGTTDVTSSCAITVTPGSGISATRSGNSVSITAVANDGSIAITGTYPDGSALPAKTIYVTLNKDAPPPASTKSTIGEQVCYAANNTSYVEASASVQTLTLVSPANGHFYVQFDMSYQASGGHPRTLDMNFKAQFRLPGGSWQDVGAEAIGTRATSSPPEVNEPGNEGVASGIYTITLTGNQSYEWRMIGRKAGGNVTTAGGSGYLYISQGDQPV